MRVRITFQAKENITLPPNYNYMVQSLIYRHIDKKLSNFLHEKGFLHGKRTFKLFTFSRLQGKIKFLSSKRLFEINPPFSLVISSPVEGFLESLAENLLKTGLVKINGQQIYFQSINVYSTPQFNKTAKIKMLSPMTMYSTLLSPDGKRKTYYYSPFEKDFSRLMEENLKKKYEVIQHKKADSLEFSIEPDRVGKGDEKIIDYKGTVIKGWMGTYKITGSPELIKIAYDTGLGSKNSQGFGCFEVV